MDSITLEEATGSLEICEQKHLDRETRREEQLLLSGLWENQRNMKNDILMEEVVATNGEEDVDKEEVIANNMRLEMKKDLKTSPRWDVILQETWTLRLWMSQEQEWEKKIQVAKVEEKLQPTLLMTFIESS